MATQVVGPSVLIVEGAQGIGKTTTWLAAVERAQELSLRVLSPLASSVQKPWRPTCLVSTAVGIRSMAELGRIMGRAEA
jgi:hypothetical protein